MKDYHSDGFYSEEDEACAADIPDRSTALRGDMPCVKRIPLPTNLVLFSPGSGEGDARLQPKGCICPWNVPHSAPLNPTKARSSKLHSILWRSLKPPGYDHCLIYPVETADGARWFIEGTVLSAVDNAPFRVYYRVACDAAWNTLEFGVDVLHGLERRALRVAQAAPGRWFRVDNGSHHELKALQGCTDPDLGITPATSTLPIKRLGLKTRQRAVVRAVWVSLPGLELHSIEQSYQHVSSGHYRIESADRSYRADVRVDSFGLVSEYPGEWVRVSAAGNP